MILEGELVVTRQVMCIFDLYDKSHFYRKPALGLETWQTDKELRLALVIIQCQYSHKYIDHFLYQTKILLHH